MVRDIFKITYNVTEDTNEVTAKFYTDENKENILYQTTVNKGEAPGIPALVPQPAEDFAFWFPDPEEAITKDTDHIPIFYTE